jgi:hypothetical protein
MNERREVEEGEGGRKEGGCFGWLYPQVAAHAASLVGHEMWEKIRRRTSSAMSERGETSAIATGT